MNSTGVALSGMAAAQQRLQAHAHNLANSATDGFRRSGVSQTALAGGGTATAWTRSDAVGPAMVDDLVGQMSAEHDFMASLAVFKSADAMTGALLDAVG